MKEYISAVTDG